MDWTTYESPLVHRVDNGFDGSESPGLGTSLRGKADSSTSDGRVDASASLSVGVTLPSYTLQVKRHSSLQHLSHSPQIDGAPAIGHVTTGLFVGSLRAFADASVARESRIGSLLCVAAELADAPLPAHLRNIPLLTIPLRDSCDENLTPALLRAVEHVDGEIRLGRNVGLFCQAGKSRSVAIALGYLLLRGNPRFKTATDALADLQTRYSAADPNIFFMQQLETLASSTLSASHSLDDEEG